MLKFMETRRENLEKQKRENDKKELINRMNWLIKDHYINENNWITPEMYWDDSEEGIKKFEYCKMNKLRGNWFNGVFADCENAIREFIDDADLKDKLTQKLKKLLKEVGLAIDQGKTNRELVEKTEALMEEIKDYL